MACLRHVLGKSNKDLNREGTKNTKMKINRSYFKIQISGRGAACCARTRAIFEMSST
jgi:hypothetical protein